MIIGQAFLFNLVATPEAEEIFFLDFAVASGAAFGFY